MAKDNAWSTAYPGMTREEVEADQQASVEQLAQAELDRQHAQAKREDRRRNR